MICLGYTISTYIILDLTYRPFEAGIWHFGSLTAVLLHITTY